MMQVVDNAITRQHSETEISEIIGKKCKGILAVEGNVVGSIVVFYVFLGNKWLRMFLDTDVLFVDVCDHPEQVEDLEEGAEYLGLATMHRVKNEVITQARMKDGLFLLGFKCGTDLLFEQCGDETILRVVK